MIKPNMVAATNKDPIKWMMPLETPTAPLDFGDGAVVAGGVPDSDGGLLPLGVVGGDPLGVVGGDPLAAATTLISSFMPPAQ